MKQIFINGIHDYDFEKKDRSYNLYFNQGDQWQSHTRGKLALSLEDTGNGFKVKKIKGREFNYSQALYLTILLKIAHRADDYKFEMSDKIEF